MSYTLAYKGAEIDEILGRAATGGALDTAIAAKQDALTFDAVPTEGSTNPAESGGIYDAIQAGGAAALAAFATDTVSGDVVSFPDGADGIPVKSFTGSILPQQNLNGQSAPYPAGGGANKWDEQWEVGAYNGSTGAKVIAYGRIRSKNKIPVTPNATYFFKGSSSFQVYEYGSDESYIRYTGIAADTELAVGATTHYITFNTGANSGESYNNDIAINYPSTVTTYSPYSNICPISGWTGAEIYRTGINLCNPSTITDGYRVSNNGNIIVGANNAVTDYIPIKGNTSYYLRNSIGGASFYSTAVYDENKTFIKNISLNGSGAQSGEITTPENARYIRVNMLLANKADFAFNYPSTVTAYHAYDGQTITIDWTDEAGTVYGGTLNVTTGLLTVDRATLTLDGASAYSDFGSNTYGRTISGVVMKTDGDIISSQYPAAMTNSWANMPDMTLWAYVYGQNSYVRIRNSSIASAADFKAALAANPIQVVYTLATPITYQLTPTQVETLLGANTVWTDVGSATGMTYRADTALYIQKLLNGGGTLSTLSMASPSPSLSLGRVGVLAETEVAEPEQTDEEAEQLEQTEEPEQTEEA